MAVCTQRGGRSITTIAGEMAFSGSSNNEFGNLSQFYTSPHQLWIEPSDSVSSPGATTDDNNVSEDLNGEECPTGQ